MTAVNDLVSGIINRIDEIPSDITGSPIIYEFANDARIDIQNITGETVSESDVPEKYQSILKNLGAAYTLSRMTGVGIDFDYSLGNFRVNKGKNNDMDTNQMEFFISQANMSLKGVGRSVPFKATWS